MFCSKCGSKSLDPLDAHCGECGAKLPSSAASAAPAAPRPTPVQQQQPATQKVLGVIVLIVLGVMLITTIRDKGIAYVGAGVVAFIILLVMKIGIKSAGDWLDK